MTVAPLSQQNREVITFFRTECDPLSGHPIWDEKAPAKDRYFFLSTALEIAQFVRDHFYLFQHYKFEKCSDGLLCQKGEQCDAIHNDLTLYAMGLARYLFHKRPETPLRAPKPKHFWKNEKEWKKTISSLQPKIKDPNPPVSEKSLVFVIFLKAITFKVSCRFM